MPTTKPPPAPPKAAPKHATPPPRVAPQASAPSSNGGAAIGKLSASKRGRLLVLNAVEGWGKTTAGAGAPKPVILMARNETGYLTLLEGKRVPQVDGAIIETWESLLATVDDLIENPGDHEFLVLDALGGFEKLCHECVCARDFDNDFGPKGFISYQTGYDVAVNDWLQLLQRLERLRAKTGMSVIFLSHCQIRPFKNPLGADFDRYIADCHQKTWSPTHKWADAVFFGNFFAVVEKDSKKAKKGKGVGGHQRVLYTERRDAYDAKNRYGMAEMITMPDNPADNYAVIDAAIKGEQQ